MLPTYEELTDALSAVARPAISQELDRLRGLQTSYTHRLTEAHQARCAGNDGAAVSAFKWALVWFVHTQHSWQTLAELLAASNRGEQAERLLEAVLSYSSTQWNQTQERINEWCTCLRREYHTHTKSEPPPSNIRALTVVWATTANDAGSYHSLLAMMHIFWALASETYGLRELEGQHSKHKAEEETPLERTRSALYFYQHALSQWLEATGCFEEEDTGPSMTAQDCAIHALACIEVVRRLWQHTTALFSQLGELLLASMRETPSSEHTTEWSLPTSERRATWKEANNEADRSLKETV